MDILILALFNLVFFWPIYSNPFRIARSELLSTFFPSWLYIGRQARKKRSWSTEPFYWLNFHAHPVLSAYYPPHVLTAFIGAFLNLDNAFKLLTGTILAHFIWMSLGWYWFFSLYFSHEIALFGALTFTYQAYHIRQQPCIVYTFSWFPFILLGITNNSIWVSSISIGMSLIAGYFPVTFYLLPLAFLQNPGWTTVISMELGVFFALPQLIPFFRHLPNTIRGGKVEHPNVGPWETSFFIGLVPIILLLSKPIWVIFLLSLYALPYLLKEYLPRVYQRAWIVPTYLAIWLSLQLVPQDIAIYLIIAQAISLVLVNSTLLPTLPFAELWEKPSRAFNTKLTQFLSKNLGDGERVSGLPYPLFTGIINEIPTLGYCGGMQTKEMAKWRGDTNPNGSGFHDWFQLRDDSSDLDKHRVRFAYTGKKLDWLSTGIPRLWENPRFKVR